MVPIITWKPSKKSIGKRGARYQEMYKMGLKIDKALSCGTGMACTVGRESPVSNQLLPCVENSPGIVVCDALAIDVVRDAFHLICGAHTARSIRKG